MEKFEIVRIYDDYKNRLLDIKTVIKPNEMTMIIKENEQKMTDVNFWSDTINANSIINQTNNLKDILNTYNSITKDIDDLTIIIEFNDEELFQEAEILIEKIKKELENFEIELLLSEEYDSCNAIMELHPGAGGTESQDWALMLYRMYKHYADNHKYTFELLDYQEANEAGIKSVTFVIKGKHAYGMLKSEKGVHRLVRISPFDSNARRHTSFVACNVTPELNDDVVVDLNMEDLRIDTYRSSGAGGQHVNTTDSAIRITHIPTGIVVSCQNERSQIQNRERALKVLKSKLYQLMLQEKKDQLKNINGILEDNTFGSQIRSYILQPYTLVKDHRTSTESNNPNAVLDGEIDIFINAYLKYNASKGGSDETQNN